MKTVSGFIEYKYTSNPKLKNIAIKIDSIKIFFPPHNSITKICESNLLDLNTKKPVLSIKILENMSV